jgi:hypothetical protein
MFNKFNKILNLIKQSSSPFILCAIAAACDNKGEIPISTSFYKQIITKYGPNISKGKTPQNTLSTLLQYQTGLGRTIFRRRSNNLELIDKSYLSTLKEVALSYLPPTSLNINNVKPFISLTTQAPQPLIDEFKVPKQHLQSYLNEGIYIGVDQETKDGKIQIKIGRSNDIKSRFKSLKPYKLGAIVSADFSIKEENKFKNKYLEFKHDGEYFLVPKDIYKEIISLDVSKEYSPISLKKKIEDLIGKKI